jgi:hypothetical protein
MFVSESDKFSIYPETFPPFPWRKWYYDIIIKSTQRIILKVLNGEFRMTTFHNRTPTNTKTKPERIPLTEQKKKINDRYDSLHHKIINTTKPPA